MTNSVSEMKRPDCILCQSEAVTHLRKIELQQLVSLWQKSLHIDIRSEIQSVEELNLYRCENCFLMFFSPQMPGSELFYEKLQTFDWYYMDEKWEFSAALHDIRHGSLLEVGCARGSFLELAANQGSQVEGVEINQDAAKFVLEQGYTVHTNSINKLVELYPEKYDNVCLFQVIEHVANPGEFLADCLKLLRPNGVLIFSVPNHSGFIRRDKNNPLELPPHHTSHWTERTLRTLDRILPVDLIRVEKEPLATYHYDWFTQLQLQRFWRFNWPGYRILSLFADNLVAIFRRLGLYSRFHGHTIYGCFQKIG